MNYSFWLIVTSVFLMFSSAQASTFVYIGNSASNEISIHQLNQDNGNLTLINKVKIPNIIKVGKSSPMTISPDKRFIYVASRGEPRVISSFKIEPTSGELTYIGHQMMDDSIAYITTDRTGKYLISASYPQHKIIINSISQQGLVQKQQQILNNYPNAHAVLIDKNNRYVLVPTLGDDRVYQFELDSSSGYLKSSTQAYIDLKKKSGPRHLIFHPNGKFVYVIGESDASVHVFDFNLESGILKEKQTIFTLASKYNDKRKAAADIHITSNGNFLYSSERRSSTISGFKVNSSTGILTPIEVIQTEKWPRGFSIDPTGKFILVVGQRSNQMSSYSINETSGKLTKLDSYEMGENPNWIEIVSFP
jgi:6-phosphogluconolactonase